MNATEGATARPKFTPTPEQIRAAETVFLAMMLVQTTRSVVLDYQRRILAEGGWKVRPELAEHQVHPAVIEDPQSSFLMSDADFAVYQERCAQAAKAAGLSVAKPGNCPLLEAQENLRQAQWELVSAMDGTHPIGLDRVVMLSPKYYEQFIDLLLKLLAPFVRDAKDVLGAIIGRGEPPAPQAGVVAG